MPFVKGADLEFGEFQAMFFEKVENKPSIEIKWVAKQAAMPQNKPNSFWAKAGKIIPKREKLKFPA